MMGLPLSMHGRVATAAKSSARPGVIWLHFQECTGCSESLLRFGLMAGHKLEETDRVYIVDIIAAPGAPGACVRYCNEDFLLKRLPLKLSPHQIGIQEMLLVSSLRGRCPKELFLLGIIPCSVEPGTALSPLLQRRLPELASQLITELAASDHVMITSARVPRRQAPAIGPHPSHRLRDPLKSAHKGNNPSD